jgi:uncharacterized protein YbbC (DUF1343 family)
MIYYKLVRIINYFILLTIFSTNAIAQIYHPGAHQMNEYMPLIAGKKIGMVVNQTSTIGVTHLVDTFLKSNISIEKIFAPEHGYRGNIDAGEYFKSGKDPKTGIPIHSLYGSKKKPSAKDLKGIEVMVFDIQDVGVRFYTYLTTLHYIMEACAENKIPLIVLDRPNPNGYYIDGPVMQSSCMSFVGMHPVPIVYGMTIGEYAQMINGEKWLKNLVQTDLKIIKCGSYVHSDSLIDIPIKPSPNLPNKNSIHIYPSLCLFEGTNVSVGRGTDKQFQVYGSIYISYKKSIFFFTPVPKVGAKVPLFLNEKCYGEDLSKVAINRRFSLKYVLNAYKNFSIKDSFFIQTGFFHNLAGTKELKAQIIAGKSEKQIRKTWEKDLEVFKAVRRKYLMYE